MQITCDKGLFSIEGYSKTLTSPFFFPSISSVQTNHDVYDYFQLIKRTCYPAFLVSAYDVFYHKKRAGLSKEISALSQGSFFVLMDSGHYEAYWTKDDKWTFDKFRVVLKDCDVDLCFSFDVYFDEKGSPKTHIKKTIQYAAMTGGAQKSGITIPIVHSTPKLFPSTILKIVNGINSNIIGVTERELGFSMLERATNLRRIRVALKKAGKDVAIHLLGTGNPTSLLVYFLCGADFFDALEWCKNVVNPSNGHLYHFVQMDLIDCRCKICKMKGLSYPARVTSHNLLFYERFTDEIRSSLSSDKKLNRLLTKYLPNHLIPKVEKLSVRI